MVIRPLDILVREALTAIDYAVEHCDRFDLDELDALDRAMSDARRALDTERLRRQ